jgi:hypothetical protein
VALLSHQTNQRRLLLTIFEKGMGSIAKVVSLDPVVTGLSVERTSSRALCGTGVAWFLGSHRR